MDVIIPANYITLKIVFMGVEDPKSHLMAFNAQMIISGGTKAIHCKMFMGTFTGTTLQWFSGLLDGHIIISLLRCFWRKAKTKRVPEEFSE